MEIHLLKVSWVSFLKWRKILWRSVRVSQKPCYTPVIRFISNYAYYQYFLQALTPALTFTLKFLVQINRLKHAWQRGNRLGTPSLHPRGSRTAAVWPKILRKIQQKVKSTPRASRFLFSTEDKKSLTSPDDWQYLQVVALRRTFLPISMKFWLLLWKVSLPTLKTLTMHSRYLTA